MPRPRIEPKPPPPGAWFLALFFLVFAVICAYQQGKNG